MLPANAVPAIEGKGGSFPGCAVGVGFWRQVTNLEVFKCAVVLTVQMDSTAREVCVAIGNDKLLELDSAGSPLTVARDYLAPHAMDAVYLDVVSFSHVRKMAQTLDVYLVKSDLLRRMAEARIQPGSPSPDASVAVLRL